jgi:hypothetical protein
MILEKFDKLRGVWVGLHAYDSVHFHSVAQLTGAKIPDWPWLWSYATTRNYRLFGEICDGVRGESSLGYTERGVPDDVSDLARMKIEDYGDDGHSHSWLYVPEFLAAWGRVHASPEKQAEEDVKNLAGEIAYVSYTPVVTMVLDEANITPETARDYRIVFFFDN